MAETFQLAEKLRTEGARFTEFFGGLTDSQWATEVYSEGSVWTVRSILAHLMTAERAFITLFEGIRRGGGGASEDFVIDRYNARQQEKTRALSIPQLFEEYKSGREKMIQWVSAIQDSDLERTGRHPYLGVTTLREMIKLVYVHNQMHLRDLRRVLESLDAQE
jgi:uncharacterized damage-inducible protein DinB